jgi:hypothetical protein
MTFVVETACSNHLTIKKTRIVSLNIPPPSTKMPSTTDLEKTLPLSEPTPTTSPTFHSESIVYVTTPTSADQQRDLLSKLHNYYCYSKSSRGTPAHFRTLPFARSTSNSTTRRTDRSSVCHRLQYRWEYRGVGSAVAVLCKRRSLY